MLCRLLPVTSIGSRPVGWARDRPSRTAHHRPSSPLGNSSASTSRMTRKFSRDTHVAPVVVDVEGRELDLPGRPTRRRARAGRPESWSTEAAALAECSGWRKGRMMIEPVASAIVRVLRSRSSRGRPKGRRPARCRRSSGRAAERHAPRARRIRAPRPGVPDVAGRDIVGSSPLERLDREEDSKRQLAPRHEHLPETLAVGRAEPSCSPSTRSIPPFPDHRNATTVPDGRSRKCGRGKPFLPAA